VSPKHIPQRTCVACGRVQPKRELIRLVRTHDAGVQVDESGKLPGRGAYLCRRVECWEMALRGGALDRALKTALNAEEKQILHDDIARIM